MRPLIYQITNTVSAQLQADVTVLLGGCAIMSRSVLEAAEIAARSDAMLINIGTPPADALDLYRAALTGAAAHGVPTLLDLTGYGFTKFRAELVDPLLREFHFAVIKGNEAEIAALAGVHAGQLGVTAAGEVSGIAEMVRACALKFGCAVYATGAEDHLSDGERDFTATGGSALLSATSGTGCALGSVTALYCARFEPFEAAQGALTNYRRAAEKAAVRARGAYSFRTEFLDELSRSGVLSEEE